MPRQCIPPHPCPNGSSEEQNGSIATFNCIKRCPSTSSVPTTTTWAPNRAFGLSPGIPQRCCGQPRSSLSSIVCQSHIDVVLDGVHPTLFQHLIQGWVYPLMLRPPIRNVLPCHPIWRMNMETLELGQSGCAQDLRLASVQEDGFSFCSTCQTRAHIPFALQKWFPMAWMLLSSCESKCGRYWNTSTLSNTSPCTMNFWHEASAIRTAMSH